MLRNQNWTSREGLVEEQLKQALKMLKQLECPSRSFSPSPIPIYERFSVLEFHNYKWIQQQLVLSCSLKDAAHTSPPDQSP